jgi:transcriptional regulator with XRE-family HTH domain
VKAIDPTLAGAMTGDHFSLRMRKARENAGVKRPVAARAMGLTPAQLGKVERGTVKMVSDPKTLVAAGKLYGVPDVWLYAGASAGMKFVPEWYTP